PNDLAGQRREIHVDPPVSLLEYLARAPRRAALDPVAGSPRAALCRPYEAATRCSAGTDANWDTARWEYRMFMHLNTDRSFFVRRHLASLNFTEPARTSARSSSGGRARWPRSSSLSC